MTGIPNHGHREQPIGELHDTVRDLTGAETKEQVGAIAVGAAKDVLDLPINGVYLQDDPGSRLVPVAWTDEAEDVVGEPPAFAAGEGLAWQTFETGVPGVYEDVSSVPGRINSDTDVGSEFVLPLGGHGILIVGSTETGAFDDTEVSLAKILAVHTTTALDRVEHERKLKALHDVADDLTEEGSVEEICERTIEASQDILSLDQSLVALEDDGVLVPMSVADDMGADQYGEMSVEEGIAGKTYRTGESFLIEDLEANDDVEPRGDHRALIIVPVGTHGNFQAASRTPGAFDERDLELVELLISHAENAFDRVERERTLRQLHDATRDLMLATTEEEVTTTGSETATEILDLPMNGVHLYDPDEHALVPVAWTDETETLLDGSPPALPVEDSLAGRAYRRNEVETHSDVTETDGPFNSDTPFRSELFVPLGDHGVFVVSSTERDGIGSADEMLARVFAANIETALDRVERRRALRRERDRLDRYVDVVSHDLRNPLEVANAGVELARTEVDSDHLDDVATAHERMSTLIDDLITLAREGKRIQDPAPVSLRSIVEGCWRNVATKAATLECDVDGTVLADRSRLRQLLENLIRNAVDHGGDDVTVAVGMLADRNGFYVADDGPGVPPDERDAVFDAGYSTGGGGTGLGLSIVREIVDAHDWEILLTDSETGGARFEVVSMDFVE